MDDTTITAHQRSAV